MTWFVLRQSHLCLLSQSHTDGLGAYPLLSNRIWDSVPGDVKAGIEYLRKESVELCLESSYRNLCFYEVTRRNTGDLYRPRGNIPEDLNLQRITVFLAIRFRCMILERHIHSYKYLYLIRARALMPSPGFDFCCGDANKKLDLKTSV
jgi:hypothetical protein